MWTFKKILEGQDFLTLIEIRGMQKTLNLIFDGYHIIVKHYATGKIRDSILILLLYGYIFEEQGSG